MLGYSAMGSCTIATRPMMTMRIEITIATMGRLMKNLAISGLFRWGGRRGRARLGPHLLAGSHAIGSFDDDSLAGLEPLRDDPLRAYARVDLDRPYLDRLVGLDDGDLLHPLHVLHSPLGNEERVLLHLDHRPYLGVLARTQHAAGIRKDASREHGAGGHVDLSIQGGGPSR